MGAIEEIALVTSRFFSKLGFFIGSQPKQVILVTLLICFSMSLGIFRFAEDNNVRTEYSPINAPSRLEYAVAKKFLGQVGSSIRFISNLHTYFCWLACHRKHEFAGMIGFFLETSTFNNGGLLPHAQNYAVLVSPTMHSVLHSLVIFIAYYTNAARYKLILWLFPPSENAHLNNVENPEVSLK